MYAEFDNPLASRKQNEMKLLSIGSINDIKRQNTLLAFTTAVIIADHATRTFGVQLNTHKLKHFNHVVIQGLKPGGHHSSECYLLREQFYGIMSSTRPRSHLDIISTNEVVQKLLKIDMLKLVQFFI